MTSQVKPGKSNRNQTSDQTDLQATLSERTWKMLKHQPLVPIGLAATVCAMGMAFQKFRVRDSVRMNYWLRARVLGQAFTILAMVYGTMTLQNSSAMSPVDFEKEKQSAEFRERLKDAEMSHQVETAVTAVVKQGVRQGPGKDPAAAVVEQKTDKKDSGALDWFRNLLPPLKAPSSSSSPAPKAATPSGSENREI